MFLRSLVCSAAKTSTRITGLDVVPNAREVLLNQYNAILRKLAEKIPEGTTYRDTLEETVNYHKGILEASDDVEVIEREMGLGQIEEVIQMTKGELNLIDKMAEWRPWEGQPVDVKVVQARTGKILYSRELEEEEEKRLAAEAEAAKQAEQKKE